MTDQTGGNRPAFPASELIGTVRGMLLRGDVGLALGLITILVMLILPMPAFLLDMFLAVSVTFSVMILMTVLFIQKPLEFSSFPAILLISTLLRLSLNLASTRLILSQGHEGTDAAGAVIEAFAGFVMQGDFIIGVIVFSILTLVNFVVITKGSGRIAEVAARFSLDAMPGKQMAIDADLSAGMIDEAEARRRRRELEQESTFFGAMDGASKFVRGDAVAGLVITLINVVGGVVIGLVRHDLGVMDAADSYVVLTIGDGLVSQIPALIVSVAAGMLVSKAGISGTADKAVIGQLTNYPIAMGLASALLLVLATLPGMPFVPFLALAAAAGAGAWLLPRQRARREAEARAAEAETIAPPPPVAEEPIATALSIDLVRLELGYGLLSLINAEQSDARMTDQIKGLRRQLASEIGFVMPSVRIQDNL
ncbi:MAG TPA: FHIPEP family type III secretion protein, partial [Arenibaculum sp.]|nr:FHIPEP family type III secretion protein [Arenibaculum sp.]